MDTPWYQMWKLFVVLICIASSFIYAFMAAFYNSQAEKGNDLVNLEISFEVVCGIDILVQFILEYKPDDSLIMVRDL